MDRRRFIQELSNGFFGASLLPLSGLAKGSYPSDRQAEIFSSAVTDKQGKHHLATLNTTTATINTTDLPGRAHEVFKHPKKNILAVVARRPGYYLNLIHSETGEQLKSLPAMPNHHFYGHGLFTADGRYLITTEAQISSGEGRVVVRDSNNHYEVVASYFSNGIGPHQIKLSPNQKVLIVANGGILTHPDKGREKLNLDTMSPSLDYLNLANGKVLESHTLSPELHQLSIRHIDVNTRGQVAIAMQYQGGVYDEVPLVGLHKQGKPIKLIHAPLDTNRRMKQYCGSVAFDQSGDYFCISNPRGDLATFWNAKEALFITSTRCRDVCGVSANGIGKFALSNGEGKLFEFALSSMKLRKYELNAVQRLFFDNHLSLHS